MASKSKRRGRVFRASCILAALIIAGSSFAWFTSRDEVTNRLTANSDYGVSIVESFSPPKNWIPGQNINKDTYAVNTGNIDAFVKNDISGVLNYTYEKLVDTFAAAGADAVVLNDAEVAGIEGATTMEAGSFLAWTDTAEPLGDKNVKYDGTAWKPTASGVYIFRRAIDTENGGATPANPTFAYSGYYYDHATGKYYKIVIGKDKHPYDSNHNFDVSSTTLGDNVTFDKKDGKVTDGVPVVQYVTLGTVANEDVIFTFEDKVSGSVNPNDDHPARLVATSNGAFRTSDVSNTYDESATAARAEVAYRNSLKDSDIAEARYMQAKADYDYAMALAKARDELTEAAKTAKAAYDKVNTPSTGTEDVATTKRTAVTTATTTFEGVEKVSKLLIPDPKLNPEDNDCIAADLRAAIAAMGDDSATKKNYNELVNAYKAMYDTTNANSRISKIKTALTNLKNATDYDTPAEVTQELEKLKQELNNLKNDLNAYKIKVANLVTASTATGLDLSSTADTIRSNVDTLLGYYPDVNSAVTPLSTAVSEFTEAYANNTSSGTALTAAETKWQEAETAYNTAVGTAKLTYEGVVGTTTKDYTLNRNVYDSTSTVKYTLVNNAASIVPSYSANRNTGTAPSITANNVECYAAGSDTKYAKDYLYYAAFVPGATGNSASNPDVPNTTTKKDVLQQVDTANFNELTPPTGATATNVKALKDAMDAAKNAANTAKKTLDDAVASKAGTDVIKIYVNLVDGYDTNWKMDETTLNTTDVDFYLKKILAAGETSAQLIDSVEMAETVTAGAYKDMTFDLNIGLDSAQITYADDQTTITDEAVKQPPFDMKVTNIDQTTKAVTWDTMTSAG